MNIKYTNEKLKESFSNYDVLKKTLDMQILKKLKRYMDSFLASNDFGIFLSTSLDHPEALTGFTYPTWSLQLSKNVRLIFKPLNYIVEKSGNINVNVCKEIEIKGVCDYHGGKYNWYIS